MARPSQLKDGLCHEAIAALIEKQIMKRVVAEDDLGKIILSHRRLVLIGNGAQIADDFRCEGQGHSVDGQSVKIGTK